MLQLLHIENIAIIEAADIVFEPGFNVLTGETGAGKSIVIDAMSAVLGRRASRELIRTGAPKAFVSACFTGITPQVMEEFGIEPDEELLLQREIHTDGRNVCRRRRFWQDTMRWAAEISPWAVMPIRQKHLRWESRRRSRC